MTRDNDTYLTHAERQRLRDLRSSGGVEFLDVRHPTTQRFIAREYVTVDKNGVAKIQTAGIDAADIPLKKVS